MKQDERLKTIYEVIAPHVVRSESNWRDYLSFAARFHKHSFDNMLLVYAQKDDVTMLATIQQWNSVGRHVNQYEKGIAVCIYENARMTIDHLFDISQTNGRVITPTDWRLDEVTKLEMASRLSYSHGYEAPQFHELLYALAAEAVGDHYEQYLQGLGEDIKGHLFSELPAGGFEAQFIQLLVDSVAYVIGKRCCLPDEEIRLGDGMRTISHFNTLPLIARAGNAVTAISKGILLELERTLRIINKERKEHHEQAENRTELHRERRDSLSQSSSVQRQPGGSAPGPVREDGAGIPPREPPRPVYNFENGWQPYGDHAPGPGGGNGENRSPDPADAQGRPIAGDGGHAGADEALQQPQAASGGNRPARAGADSPVDPLLERTDETPASTEKEPSIDGSFFVPFSPDAAGRWSQLTSVEITPLPFEEGLPSAGRAAEMKEWLKQHGSRFTPTYTILYHATGENIPVTEKGLLPTSGARRRSYQSESGYVYLAATPERAKSFGDLGNGSQSIVYEVIVPVHKLLPDADQLHNLRAAGTDVGNSIEESIVYAGGARVKGAIEQWQVRPFDYAGYLQYKETLAKADEAPAPAPMSDEEVRRHYEFILTSTDLYPAELHQGMREILADPPPDGYWIRKAPAVCALFSKYGNREYQGEVLYRTVLRGEDGISMYFGDGYTYLPWHTVANIVDAMIEDGDYPAPLLAEPEPDPVGDYNIPDEIDEMPRQMETDAINRIMAVVSEYEQEDSQAQTLAAPDYSGEQLTLAGIGRTDEDIFREDVDIDLTRAAPQPERSREELLAEAVLLEGSHVSGGKRRIYDTAAGRPAAAALASFLKNEYGIGGFSGEKPLLFVDYNSAGLIFRWLDEENQEQVTKLTWNKAANIVQDLVDGGRYLEQPPQAAEAPAEEQAAHGASLELPVAGPEEETRLLDEALDAHNGQIDMLLQAVRGELTVGTIRYSIFEGRPHIGHIEVLEGCRRQGIVTQMVRYLQGQYPHEEIEWGYLTDDGSAFYHAVVEERPNEDYLRVKSDLEDITRQFEQYAARMDNGGILSPMEAEDMDELSDIQYRLEGELQDLRPTQAFVRMEDRGGAGENEAESESVVLEDGAGRDFFLAEPPGAGTNMPAAHGEAKPLPPQPTPPHAISASPKNTAFTQAGQKPNTGTTSPPSRP